MESAIDLTDPDAALDLANIRFQLIRLEDTIIYNLIERVQFPHNKPIYIPQHIKIPNHSGSFLEWILLQTERVHAQVRRYQSPDEYPFFPNQLPKPFLAPLSYPKILYANSVNYNQELMQAYVNHILPAACCVRPGIPDDRGETKENYGSAAVLDVACLQALSRRIHFGKFVAEAKFRQQQEAFSDMIRRKDIDGLTAAITKPEVEQQVLKRLELKARTYGTDPATKNKDAKNEGGTVSEKPQPKINVGAVVAMYKDWVIPLTKKVEIDYLLQRLEPESEDRESRPRTILSIIDSIFWYVGVVIFLSTIVLYLLEFWIEK